MQYKTFKKCAGCAVSLAVAVLGYYLFLLFGPMNIGVLVCAIIGIPLISIIVGAFFVDIVDIYWIGKARKQLEKLQLGQKMTPEQVWVTYRELARCLKRAERGIMYFRFHDYKYYHLKESEFYRDIAQLTGKSYEEVRDCFNY